MVDQGRNQRGLGGGDDSAEPHIDSKFHVHGKFWINMINLEYRIYPKYSHPYSLSYTYLPFYCL